MFGVFWTAMQNRNIPTPQKYSEEIINALYSKVRKNEDENKKYVKVKDMFVIPDYSGFLVDFIDPHFANYSKLDMTQHQFIFTAVRMQN